MNDWWAHVALHIPAAIEELRRLGDCDLRGIEQLMEARYRIGQEHYRGDWLTRPPEWFDGEAAEELADWLTYRAMRLARIAMIDAGRAGGGA